MHFKVSGQDEVTVRIYIYIHVLPRVPVLQSMLSSKVVASMVSSQLQTEAQFLISTLVDSDVNIDPSKLSEPSVDIIKSCSVDDELPAKEEMRWESSSQMLKLIMLSDH